MLSVVLKSDIFYALLIPITCINQAGSLNVRMSLSLLSINNNMLPKELELILH
jgi:hypothetical protein